MKVISRLTPLARTLASSTRAIFYAKRSFIFLFLLSTITSYAKGEKMDLHDQIRNLRTISAATVTFVPPDMFFRVALNEAKLREVGCTYISQEKLHLARLVDLLARADIRAVSPHEGSWETREGIFLTLADGTEVKLLLGRGFTNYSTIRGEFTNPLMVDKLPVTADVSLLQNLYQWAAQAEIPIDKVSYNKRICDSLIHH